MPRGGTPIDHTDAVYGHWQALRRDDPKQYPRGSEIGWWCRCLVCGVERLLLPHQFRNKKGWILRCDNCMQTDPEAQKKRKLELQRLRRAAAREKKAMPAEAELRHGQDEVGNRLRALKSAAIGASMVAGICSLSASDLSAHIRSPSQNQSLDQVIEDNLQERLADLLTDLCTQKSDKG
jgi:hypothetical protein